MCVVYVYMRKCVNAHTVLDLLMYLFLACLSGACECVEGACSLEFVLDLMTVSLSIETAAILREMGFGAKSEGGVQGLATGYVVLVWIEGLYA